MISFEDDHHRRTGCSTPRSALVVALRVRRGLQGCARQRHQPPDGRLLLARRPLHRRRGRPDRGGRPAHLRKRHWQFKKQGVRRILGERTASPITRTVDGACIFLNRPGFERVRRLRLPPLRRRVGVRKMDLQPDVCWQLPLRVEDHTDDYGCHLHPAGVEAPHWGPGGDDFHWWCTESSDASPAATRCTCTCATRSWRWSASTSTLR